MRDIRNKIIVLWELFWLNRKIKKESLDPIAPATIIAQLEVLQKLPFKRYSPNVGKKIIVRMSLVNVNELMGRLRFIETTMVKKDYFDSNYISMRLPLQAVNLDSFLLTTKQYPIKPEECIDELLKTLQVISSVIYSFENDPMYLEYCERRMEWVFMDIRSLTEALFVAAKE